MILSPELITLKNGRSILLRSPTVEEAEALALHQRTTSEETYFMARYPEEVVTDPEAVRQRIRAVSADPQAFSLSAYWDGKMVANLHVDHVGPHIKYRHRAGLGISIQAVCRDMGLGSFMVERAVRQAGRNGFEQLELSVFEDNSAAIHVYEKAGFLPTGVTPRAFLLKDGSYRDELHMAVFFT